MSTKVFVGNLSYNTNQDSLTSLLSEAGAIVDVYIPADRNTGRPRGFAFVEFSSEEEAAACIEKFNEHELDGRKLNINAAEDRPRRPGGGGGGGGGFRPSGGGGDFDGGDFYGGSRGGKPAKPKGSRRGKRAKKRSL